MEKSRQPESEWYASGLRFSCTQCGNCCTGPPGYVHVTDQEQKAIADHLGLDRQEFLKRYARRFENFWSLKEIPTEHGHDCIFLKRDPATGKGLCSIYQVRPAQCRTWPFWPENLRSSDAWLRASNRCPGMQKGLEGQGHLYPVESVRIQREATPKV